MADNDDRELAGAMNRLQPPSADRGEIGGEEEEEQGIGVGVVINRDPNAENESVNVNQGNDETGQQRLSEYELLRLRNIQRNEERLRNLGLLRPPPPPQRPPAQRQQRTVRSQPTRHQPGREKKNQHPRYADSPDEAPPDEASSDEASSASVDLSPPAQRQRLEDQPPHRGLVVVGPPQQQPPPRDHDADLPPQPLPPELPRDLVVVGPPQQQPPPPVAIARDVPNRSDRGDFTVPQELTEYRTQFEADNMAWKTLFSTYHPNSGRISRVTKTVQQYQYRRSIDTKDENGRLVAFNGLHPGTTMGIEMYHLALNGDIDGLTRGCPAELLGRGDATLNAMIGITIQDDDETFNAVNARLSPHFRKPSGASLRKLLTNNFTMKYADRTVGGVRSRVKHYICYAEGEQGYRGTVSGHLLRFDLSPAENLRHAWMIPSKWSPPGVPMCIVIQIMRMYYRHNPTRPIPPNAPLEFDPTVFHSTFDYDNPPQWSIGQHLFAL